MSIIGCIRTSRCFTLACNIIRPRAYQKTFKKFTREDVEAIYFAQPLQCTTHNWKKLKFSENHCYNTSLKIEIIPGLSLKNFENVSTIWCTAHRIWQQQQFWWFFLCHFSKQKGEYGRNLEGARMRRIEGARMSRLEGGAKRGVKERLLHCMIRYICYSISCNTVPWIYTSCLNLWQSLHYEKKLLNLMKRFLLQLVLTYHILHFSYADNICVGSGRCV